MPKISLLWNAKFAHRKRSFISISLSMNYENFTLLMQKALKQASQIAQTQNHRYIENGHLLKAILKVDKHICPYLLKRFVFNLSDLEEAIDGIVAAYPHLTESAKLNVSFHVETSLNRAFQTAKKYGDDFVSIEHILLGIFLSGDTLSMLLKKNGITDSKLEQAIVELRKGKTFKRTSDQIDTLKRFAVDLNSLARKGALDPVARRSEALKQLMQILSRRKNAKAWLIGERGAGKTALINGLALGIFAGEIPEPFKHKKLFRIDIPRLLAEVVSAEQLNLQFKSILQELSQAGDKLVLFIDGLEYVSDNLPELKYQLINIKHQVIISLSPKAYQQTFASDPLFAEVFSPLWLNSPDKEEAFLMLKALKNRYEYHHKIFISEEALSMAVDLTQRFIPNCVLPGTAVDLLDEAAAKLSLERDILPESIVDIQERTRVLSIEREIAEKKSDEAKSKELQRKIANLSDECNRQQAIYETGRNLIASILDVRQQMEHYKREAVAAIAKDDSKKLTDLHFNKQQKLKKEFDRLMDEYAERSSDQILFKEYVDGQTVAEVMSLYTGLSVGHLLDSPLDQYLELEQHLQQHILGQPEALSALANCLRRKSSISQQNSSPLATILLAGPQATGKSLLARRLAKFVFKQFNTCHSFDCQLYSEQAEQLLSDIVQVLNKYPYGVLVLENIEKLPLRLHNDLRKLLTETYYESTTGQQVSCRHSIIILTTQTGSHLLTEHYKELSQANRAAIVDELYVKLLPILKNTIGQGITDSLDEVILMLPLPFAALQKVASRKIKHLQAIFEQQDIPLHITPQTVYWLAKQAYNPIYNASLLSHIIKRYVHNPVIEIYSANKPEENRVLLITLENDRLVYHEVDVSDVKQYDKAIPAENPEQTPQKTSRQTKQSDKQEETKEDSKEVSKGKFFSKFGNLLKK